MRYLLIILSLLFWSCDKDKGPYYNPDGSYLVELYKVEINGNHFTSGRDDEPMDLLISISYSDDNKNASKKAATQIPGYRGTHQLDISRKWSIFHNQKD